MFVTYKLCSLTRSKIARPVAYFQRYKHLVMGEDYRKHFCSEYSTV